MSFRQRMRAAIKEGDLATIEALVSKDARAVRLLIGQTYHADESVRRTAARGLAIASRYHTKLVERVIRSFVWAMNDESGTNAVNAPEALLAIAEEQPELLLPVVPDLTRLTTDGGLHEGLCNTLRIVIKRCPGKVGEALGEALRQRR